jgi:hypothetical protein
MGWRTSGEVLRSEGVEGPVVAQVRRQVSIRECTISDSAHAGRFHTPGNGAGSVREWALLRRRLTVRGRATKTPSPERVPTRHCQFLQTHWSNPFPGLGYVLRAHF